MEMYLDEFTYFNPSIGKVFIKGKNELLQQY